MSASESQFSGPNPKVRQRHLSNRAIVNLFIWPTLILLIAMNVFPLFYSPLSRLYQLLRDRRKGSSMGGVPKLQ